MISVAIYLVDQAYGGPEEGGWWYTHGYPITDEEVFKELPPDHRLPRYFHLECEAIAWANEVQLSLDRTINKGRRPISSVLSEGQYQARVEDGHPRRFPEQRPHYE